MTATWQHGKPDARALQVAMEGLRDAAGVPLDLAQRAVLRRKIGLICKALRSGVLPLPDVRAVDIDDQICGVVGGIGSLLTSWIGDAWKDGAIARRSRSPPDLWRGRRGAPARPERVRR